MSHVDDVDDVDDADDAVGKSHRAFGDFFLGGRNTWFEDRDREHYPTCFFNHGFLRIELDTHPSSLFSLSSFHHPAHFLSFKPQRQ